MEAEIQEMIDLDVTEPSISPYSSPVVLVLEKGRFGAVLHRLPESE